MPLLTAFILVFREEKMHGVKQLLKRNFDYKRIKPKIWYIPIICLMPFLYLLTYGIMHWLDLPLPKCMAHSSTDAIDFYWILYCRGR